MYRYTKQIENIDVLFIKLGGNYGFFFDFKGKDYGQFVYSVKLEKSHEAIPLDRDQFKILEDCALETINQLKKLNENNSTI